MNPPARNDPPKNQPPPGIEDLVGSLVVLDTDSNHIFLGRLERITPSSLCLSGADVHEVRESGLSKEAYVHEARKIGVRSNRKYTWVNRCRVVAISRLEDVETF